MNITNPVIPNYFCGGVLITTQKALTGEILFFSIHSQVFNLENFLSCSLHLSETWKKKTST